MSNDVNRGKYIEYVCDYVSPRDIKAVYIPKIFKDRIKYRNPKIKWVDMEAKIYSSELFFKNADKYSTVDSYGVVHYPDDFDDSLNYANVDEQLLNMFAKTAPIENSNSFNYFRGLTPDNQMIDISYIHYDI